jgi:septal ring factor EnvC (AmiA/AmiB activator)
MMVRSAMMLAFAFPQLRTQALALAARLEDLSRVMADIRAEGERLRTETQRLNDARTQLSELIELRRQSLTERKGALDRVRQEAAEISRNVTDLNELIARLDRVVAQQMKDVVPAPAPPPAEPTAQAVAALSPGLVPAAPPPQNPAPSAAAPAALTVPQMPAAQPPNAIVLAPTSRRTASFHPGRIKPAIPFAQATGRLPLPVQGKRIIGFGDKAHTNRSSGIVIETRTGAQVVSPMDGWVVFAGVFRSYGQILIINGGDGYHML